MTVAHLSDLHLGYDGGAGGRGRAEDFVRAFDAAIARIAGLGAELVVIAGDVFDHPNVTAPPIAAFSKAVRRLRERVPGVLVAVAAGARDTPLDPSHQGPLAVIGALESVEAATTAVRRVPLPGGKCTVTLVPHLAARRGRALRLEPDSGARWNVLVLHGAVAGGPEGSRAATVPLRGWDYIALGSRHTRAKVAARAHYCGSLERIGPNPWEEAAVDKGFLTARLDTGAVRFWPIEARAAVSLAPVDAADGGTATAARRLSEALAGVPGGIDGKLLRVPVRGLCPEDLAALDRELLASVRRRVAELRVDALPAKSR
ncbi:MAG: metallophosphoesterase [Gemmatimonadetes bacterium]|nr:metallophosphoesterase [Gemmatimonadota bacterium]